MKALFTNEELRSHYEYFQKWHWNQLISIPVTEDELSNVNFMLAVKLAADERGISITTTEKEIILYRENAQ